MTLPLPSDEDARLASLHRYDILDTLPEAVFDDFTRLASHICGTPIALISLVDADRQWFKSRVGLDVAETARDLAFCVHAIVQPDTLLEIPDATQDARFADNPLVTGDPNIRFYAGAPLVTPEGHAVGTLCVIDRTPRTLTPAQQEALATLGRQVVAQLEMRRVLTERDRMLGEQTETVQWLRAAEAALQQAHDDLQEAHDALEERVRERTSQLAQAYDSTIETISHALDLRDHDTEGHSRRVTEETLTLAGAMGFDQESLVSVRRGALLHDIGKMGVPDSILLKPGKLDADEWVIMRMHPYFAHNLLSSIDFLLPALDIPLYHHEKWDGTGYPYGLVGQEIPQAARLFAIVDVWDALRSDRPYRKGWPEEKVLEHIASLSGTHFDPAVVDAFLALHRKEFFPVPLPLAA